MSLTDEEKLHLGAQQAALIQMQEQQDLQTKVQIQQAMLEADKEQTMVQTHVLAMQPPPIQPQYIETTIPVQPPTISVQPPTIPVQPVITQPPTSIQPPPPGQITTMAPPMAHAGMAPPGMQAPPTPLPLTQPMGPPGVMMPTTTSLSQPPLMPPGTSHIQSTSMSQVPPMTQGIPMNQSMAPSPPGMSQTTSGPIPLMSIITPPGVPSMGDMTPPGMSQGPPPITSANTRPLLHEEEEEGDPEEEEDEMKLPQALEKVLAFKDERAQQVGVQLEDFETGEVEYEEDDQETEDTLPVRKEEADEEEEEQQPPQQTVKETKNKKKKKKKKKGKRRQVNGTTETHTLQNNTEDEVEIEYIQETPDIDPSNPMYSTFLKVFEVFKITDADKEKGPEKPEEKKEEIKEIPIKARGAMMEEDDDDEPKPEKSDDDKPKISKKKLKKLSRLSVAELKQLVSRPDLVEMHDVTARDPKLLLHLKATRNTVTVPRHWCYKRKYLQGKRGIEKPPFDLPDYIKATGIMEMRAALQEKEDQRSMKQKMREKARPKMGKIDIDYQKLHDAFFKWQVKPKMTIHGDLYYEGKEFETRLKEKKPGNLSDELRTALGMPIGPNCEKVPPPWLIAMQRYGPPPSYPNLKIPGLNAPIPDACSFGYHAGGWGKPPVDEHGKPLYGDVFGTQSAEFQTPVVEEEVDRRRWGELESESESEEEESDEEEEEEQPDTTGLITPGDPGLTTPSGLTSVPVGMETPDLIELRKKRIEDAMDQGGDTPALYTVLPEKRTSVGGAMMGSAHVYDVSAVTGAPIRKPGERPAEGVEVALNPDELDLDTAAMQAKYDQTMKEQQSQLEKEDLSDMVAEHAAKQKKRKAKQQDAQKGAKKYKEFKF